MKKKSFNELSEAKQRVAIARDVIDQIKSRRFLIAKGVYVGLPRSLERRIINQKFASNIPQNKCMVCALGSMFLSALKLGNEFSSHYSGICHYSINQFLTKWFTEQQAKLIEATFEMWGSRAGERGTKFYLKYPDKNKRIIAIFRNIIRNRGTFKP